MTVINLQRPVARQSWIEDKIFMGQTFQDYLRSLLTPFNAVVAVILAAGLYASILRFTQGLAGATNLSNAYPWGLWIGVDVMTGVALAAGGYTLATIVYIFRLKEYYPLAKPAILTGLLGYGFVAVGLIFDLGRPWRLPYPIAVSHGMTSVMFSVGWHLFLYLCMLIVEFSPTVFEWLRWDKARAFALKLTLWATILGVMLSTLHQAALGGLFLLAPGKVHPLWYSPLLPILFLVSSTVAGLTMVIVESTLSHSAFHKMFDPTRTKNIDGLVLGLGKAASLVLLVYFALKIMGVVHGNAMHHLGTSYGNWFLIEMLGFVLLPAVMLFWASQARSLPLTRLGALIAVLGVVFNRVNVAFVTFNWQSFDRFYPAWGEYAITIAIITLGLVAFRWIVNRMPVFYDHPAYPSDH
jgi:Ni/Fe-hydrogenase subunit HybB-like protein